MQMVRMFDLSRVPLKVRWDALKTVARRITLKTMNTLAVHNGMFVSPLHLIHYAIVDFSDDRQGIQGFPASSLCDSVATPPPAHATFGRVPPEPPPIDWRVASCLRADEDG